MRRWTIACTLSLLSAAGVSGQTRITAQRIGYFTFYNGLVDGEPVTGSTQSIGAFDFTRLQVGRESLGITSQRIGSTTFTNLSSGRTVGSFSFTSGDGFRATTQRIGSASYLSGEGDN